MDGWQITSEEYEKMKKCGWKFLLIDIRCRQQYNEEHIDGAVNMYLDEEKDECLSPEYERILSGYIRKGYRIVVYCNHGSLGMRCVRALRKHSIMAYNLYGGIEEYNKFNRYTIKNMLHKGEND